jgi:hypothetical protein
MRKLREKLLAAGLAGIVLNTPISGLSCNKEKPIPKEKPVIVENQYTFNDFKKALGKERWSKLTKINKKGFEKEWDNFREDERKLFYNIYNDPDKIYKDFSLERKKGFDDFNIRDLGTSKLEKYQALCPWFDPENPTKSDKMILYAGEIIEHLARYVH